MRSSWDSLDLLPYLNYCPVLPPFFNSYFLLCFYSSLPYVQIFHKHSTSYYFYPHPWHMGSLLETLPLAFGVSPLLHSFSLLPLSEQVLWESAVKAIPTSLAKPEIVAMLALVPPSGSTLEPVPYWYLSCPSASPLLSYFLYNYNLGQLPFSTIARLSLVGFLLPSISFLCFRSCPV